MRRAIPTALAVLLAAGGASPAAHAAEADGKALYEANCGKCHGVTGQADTAVGKAMKAASLHDPKLAAADGPDLVVKHVRNDAKHASVSKSLKDSDLQAIAAFVQRLAAGK